jgi:hypothetical protein
MNKSEKLALKAKELADEFDEHFLDLGKTLRLLQEVDLEQFRKVIQTSGIGMRKAYYLVELDRNLRPLNIPVVRLRAIGWTKLMLVSSKINKQNMKSMLEAAEKYTARQLKAFLNGDKPEANSHCVMLYFNPVEFEEFAEELKLHGAKIEGGSIANKEQALLKALRRPKE